ncbi:aminotransferase class I/II-fold pyridoxal phosphate-dependent enzyme [Pseudoalteromonas sp. S16_S37]|uniref:aminotransferase class I/II-fold pyridoxal phosphate-dependent enzyme n=1 Tax=Pseudoalteromonas sp. S16_S37 TaxID=2720228 RepID=UPI001681C20A|nr:8-amino-7-oxononanoate synthase [Pseudoalteromonas sp. S16_S37]MBD1582644.1 8-amino-7-oxononanoate synthase [Pseudoalteromonas sp. S16_S37]
MAFEYIQQSLAQRQQHALLRQRVHVQQSSARTITIAGKTYLNFASNDYLGLADSPFDKAPTATGSRSSALVTGYQSCHKLLEDKLCALLNYESALLFSTGFSANSSVLKTLFSETSSTQNCAIFQDKLNHASLIDGALQSSAKHVRFNHNDMSHLRSRLEKSPAHNKLIVSEGVFSMDGDTAPLDELYSLRQQHNAWLMLDDAHAFGVLGEDGLGSCQLHQNKPDILVITFGKAMASQGAAVLGDKALIDYMLQFNREYIYSTAMSPLMVDAAFFQLQRLLDAHAQRDKLKANINLFKRLCADKRIAVMLSDTPIQPVVLGSAENVLAAQRALQNRGIWLSAIRPPTVPENTARLRITLTAAHQEQDIYELVRHLEAQL